MYTHTHIPAQWKAKTTTPRGARVPSENTSSENTACPASATLQALLESVVLTGRHAGGAQGPVPGGARLPMTRCRVQCLSSLSGLSVGSLTATCMNMNTILMSVSHAGAEAVHRALFAVVEARTCRVAVCSVCCCRALVGHNFEKSKTVD